jgi:hypothetical protein
MPLPVRVVAVIAAAALGVELLLAAVEQATGGSGTGGPPSSSYATQPLGHAANAEMLSTRGHPVARLREPVGVVDPGTTLVVADASLDGAEVDAATRFVEGGGRLVLAGEAAMPIADALLDTSLGWRPSTPTTSARAVVPSLGVLGPTAFDRVATAGEGAFTDNGPALPVVAAGRDVVVAVATHGDGTLVVVADPSPLQNRLLAIGDNAALGLAIAGEGGRPVLFTEAAHGYGPRRGIDAIPGGWRWTLLGLVVAALVWVWSRGRRLGPVADEDDDPPPRRRAYVDAVAATLLRTRDPAGAIAPLQAAARTRLARKAGLAEDADADLRRAALGLGVSDADVDAIISPVQTHDDAVRTARAFARLGSDQ